MMMLKLPKIFLTDGLGALLSAFLLCVILVKFEHVFQMPRPVLWILLITACLFASYSLINYLLNNKKRSYLKIIAYANLLYSCLTISMTLYYRTELTTVGFMYFLSEAAIIMTLAIIELKVAFNPVDNT